MLAMVYNNLQMSLNVAKVNPRRLVHRHSELREHYSQIVKKNTLAPVYLLRFNNGKERFVLDLKEEAVALSALLSELSDSGSEIYNSYVAISDHPELADAELLDNAPSSSGSWPPEPVSLLVHRLATTQQNIGNPVYPNSHILEPGLYQFQAGVDENLFRFQIHINREDTNRTILQKLSQFLSAADIGIHPFVQELSDGRCRMCLESSESGGSFLFTLEDSGFPSGSHGLVDYLGLNQTERFPSNSQFSLNGAEKEAAHNQITLNRALAIHLLGASDEPATIRCVPHKGGILSSVDDFIAKYNHLLTSGREGGKFASSSLSGTLSNVLRHHAGKLADCGLTFEDGFLSADQEKLAQGIGSGSLKKLFGADSPFREELAQALDTISMDPIHYVEKIVVSYPNTARQNFLSPYASSLYSGLYYNNFL